MNFIAKTHPKLINCIEEQIVDLINGLPFYGQYNLNLNFYESKSLPTCGVNVSNKGLNFYYNEEFLNKLSQKEVNFIDIHELFHLLFNHPKRTVTGRYDPYLSNVVQDMIINTIIWEDISHKHVEIPKNIAILDKDGVVTNPKDAGKNMALFVPKEYDGPMFFEALYMWMREKQEEKNKKDKQNQQSNKDKGEKEEGDGDSKGEGQESKDGKGEGGKGKSGKDYGPYGKGDVDCYSLDNILDNMESKKGSWMDSHIEDEVPQDLRDSLVKDVTEKLKARGFSSGGVEKVLGKLQKKRKDYLKEIKRSLANEYFGTIKQKSISKPPRRGIEGIKGNKKVKTKINCLLDVSGSMSGLTEKVLSYIYRNDIEINLIQVDTKIQKANTIKNRKDLEKMKVKGYGGTILQPGIDELVAKYNQYNNLFLTDGMTDSLDVSQLKGKVLIISAGDKCPISKSNGKLKQIIIEEMS